MSPTATTTAIAAAITAMAVAMNRGESGMGPAYRGTCRAGSRRGHKRCPEAPLNAASRPLSDAGPGRLWMLATSRERVIAVTLAGGLFGAGQGSWCGLESLNEEERWVTKPKKRTPRRPWTSRKSSRRRGSRNCASVTASLSFRWPLHSRSWYFAYVLLADYAVGFMSTKVWGNINVGLIMGLGSVRDHVRHHRLVRQLLEPEA